MAIFTGGLLTEPEHQGIHELPISTGRYIGESFAHGLEENTTAGLLRADEVMQRPILTGVTIRPMCASTA